MSRRLILGGFVAGLAMLALVTTAVAGQQAAPKSSGSAAGSLNFTVVERALTDAVIDLGATGDSIGDMLAFGNPVFNAANTNQNRPRRGQLCAYQPRQVLGMQLDEPVAGWPHHGAGSVQ